LNFSYCSVLLQPYLENITLVSDVERGTQNRAHSRRLSLLILLYRQTTRLKLKMILMTDAPMMAILALYVCTSGVCPIVITFIVIVLAKLILCIAFRWPIQRIVKPLLVKEFIASMIQGDAFKYQVFHHLLGDDKRARFSEVVVALSRNYIVPAVSDLTTQTLISEFNLDLVGDNAVTAVSKALRTNRKITRVSFHGNAQVGNKSGSALGKALETNSSILELDLSLTKVGNAAATSLANALEKNTTLLSLKLSDTKVSDEGGAVFGYALALNKTLRTLDLAGTKAGNKTALAIAKSLSINKTLQELIIDNTVVQDQGVDFFAKALVLNSTLMKLSMKHILMTDVSADRLLEAMRKNRGLKFLALPMTVSPIITNHIRGLRNDLTVQIA